MIGKPKEGLLKSFVLHEGENDMGMLKRIRQVWGRVHKKAMSELGRKNYITREPYRQWVMEKVPDIKLPSPIEPYVCLRTPKIMYVPTREVEKLKENISRLEQENGELRLSLDRVTLA